MEILELARDYSKITSPERVCAFLREYRQRSVILVCEFFFKNC